MAFVRDTKKEMSFEKNYSSNNKVINYISKTAKIGNNVKIWHFSYIGDNTEIGNNVSIGSLVHIDYNVRIGDNCRIEGSVYIPPLTLIGNNVFIGPGAAFTNDPYPMSPKMIGVVVEDGAIIGGRAVFRPGVRVGRNSVIGMGSIVTKDVPPEKVVMGHPATVRYTRKEYDIKKTAWNASKPV